ncbi:o-methyltransferase [Perkinsus olseni]|uniref:O-methyltransferase n=1 Tax=Perkinsus olseni TaxID=32597 RepID=A0A7J6P4W7_PEROL|nr:o-methyltransferase [Perkinsus olseni]
MRTQELKSAGPPTIAKHPELTQYYYDNSIRATDLQRQFYDRIASRDQAVMAGGPDEAQFFSLFLRAMGAKKALEVGVFRGSTTAYLAQGVGEDGKVIGLDICKEFLDEVKAEDYWRELGIADRIEIRIGNAVAGMKKLIEDEDAANTFDFIFIDANKTDYDTYYELALKLAKPTTGIIAVDNTFFHGTVLDGQHADGSAIDRLNKKIMLDDRVENSMLCICDGVSIVRKRGPDEKQ